MQHAIKRFVHFCTSSCKKKKPLCMTHHITYFIFISKNQWQWLVMSYGILKEKVNYGKNVVSKCDISYLGYIKQATKASKEVKLAKRAFEKRQQWILKLTLNLFTQNCGWLDYAVRFWGTDRCYICHTLLTDSCDPLIVLHQSVKLNWLNQCLSAISNFSPLRGLALL